MMRVVNWALSGLMLGVVTVSVAQPRPPVVLEQNGVRVSLGGNYRVHGQIKVDGTPFTDQSRLYALRPNAGGRFFGYEDDIKTWSDTKVTTGSDGTVRAEYPLRAPNGEFMGTQVFELTKDRRLRFNVDAGFRGTSGRLEHRIGGIFTGWLSMQPYKAQLRDGSTTSGVMPSAPQSEDLEMSTVVKDFKSLTVETPIGPVEISTSGSLPVRLVDWRRNRYFDAEPLFWLGVSELPAEKDQRFQYGLEIKFPALRAAAAVKPDTVMELPQDVNFAYTPPEPRDVIVPTPKEVRWEKGVPFLEIGTLNMPPVDASGIKKESPWTRMIVHGGRSTTTRDSAGNPMPTVIGGKGEFVYGNSEFVEKCAQKLAQYLESNASNSPQSEIGGTSTSKPLISLRLLGSNDKMPLEHYHLKVADTVELTAETTAGLAAGVQTLRQLIRTSKKPGTVAIRRCEIDDHATLPLRCIHFFAGANDSPTHIKLIEQVLEAHKLNQLCYHADNLVWESHPEIKNPAGNSMTKSEVRKVVAAAHRANVDIMPLVASFGHSEWMLTTPELRQLAENPEFPYAYDPTKPEVYKIVDDLYAEAIELFKPKYFHIGHDEVDLKGFPQTERLQKIGLTKLFADDVWHYRNWFAERGITTVIWGDMLVGPGESPDATLAPSVEIARERRESLPKDIVVGDWHYVSDPPQTYKSLQILNEAGFDTAAVTWMHPLNVVNFVRAAADANDANSTVSGIGKRQGVSLGVIQSTWSGSKTNEEVVRKHPDQHAAYILAAEAAWNGGSMQPDQLPYDYRNYFAETWLRDMMPKEERPGWRVSPAQAVQLSSLFYDDGPGKVTCPVNKTANVLLFDLSATSSGPQEPPIASAVIAYDDGTSQTIEWKIGNNVMGQEDKRSTPGALVHDGIMTVHAHGRQPGYTHRHVHKAKAGKIKEITFTSNNQGPALVVHGITGVQ